MRNQEGYKDPVPGEAIRNIEEEEKQKTLEKKFGLCRGDWITQYKVINGKNTKKRTVIRYKIKIIRLYPHGYARVIKNNGKYDSFSIWEIIKRMTRGGAESV